MAEKSTSSKDVYNNNSNNNDNVEGKLRQVQENMSKFENVKLKCSSYNFERSIFYLKLKKKIKERLYSYFNSTEDESESEAEPEPKLKSLDLKGFAAYMKTCKKIVFMSGAGISTAAGIPDFRSPKTGLYDNLQKFNLPSSQCIFDLNYFRRNPNPFFTLAKELLPSNYKPTVSHYFQRLLVDKKMVHKIYTQNIDALESIANIPAEKIIYAHGSFNTGHCLSCRKQYEFDWIKKNIEAKQFLKCENDDCVRDRRVNEQLKVVKPDIVFFGEQMPKDFIENRVDDFNECDCLVVMGTSLQVFPFSALVDLTRKDCPRLLINRDLVGDWQLSEVNPEAYLRHNKRDVALKGDCDQACLKLVEELGFKNELVELIKKDEIRLNDINKKLKDK